MTGVHHEWTYMTSDELFVGPISEPKFISAIKSGKIQPNTKVRSITRTGDEWMEAQQLKILSTFFADQPTSPTVARVCKVKDVAVAIPVRRLSSKHYKELWKVLAFLFGTVAVLAFLGTFLNSGNDSHRTNVPVVKKAKSAPRFNAANPAPRSTSPPQQKIVEVPAMEVLTASLANNPITVPDNVKNRIRQNAEKEWPGDYEMQKYTIDEQVLGYKQIRVPIRGYELGLQGKVPEKIYRQIWADAKREWPDDYSMQSYQIQNQCDAFIELNR